MSRVGKAKIDLPKKVDVKVDGSTIRVKGPKGEMTHAIPSLLDIQVSESVLLVTRKNDSKPAKSLHGLIRMKIANMVKGVVDGFEKKLEIQGVGYRAQKKGKDLELALGYSHPIPFPAPNGIEFVMEGQTSILVKGIDKELVGQVAANIRDFRPPEPYKGKGIRYSGEVVRKKAGKAGKVGAKK